MFKMEVKYFKIYIVAAIFSIFIFCGGCKSIFKNHFQNWSSYNGDKSVSHYSSLGQIDTANVQRLKIAWAYHTGDVDTLVNSRIETNPLVINGILYGVSPRLKLFALNAATGKPQWVFDPFLNKARAGVRGINVCRGVAYWSNGDTSRIFYTVGSDLLAVDAKSGKLVTSFGNHGGVSLYDGLGRDVNGLYMTATSPGIIYKDLLIMGSTVAERGNVAPGYLRAYNIHTGELKWVFHTIPHPGEFGYASWQNKNAWKYVGGANDWAGLSLDNERGVVYAATGSATPDFYGGFRKGKDLFADCVLALNAESGRLIWFFQTVHHDLWDMDNDAPPNLVTLNHNGKKVDAVVQIDKAGYVYVLNRDDGKPLFPVKEITVPTISTLKGEAPYPTQPIPVLPKPIGLSVFTPLQINPFVPDSSQVKIRRRLAKLQTGNNLETGNRFLPPSKQGVMVYPGFSGGAEWGGASFDPTSGFLYVNANQIPCQVSMVENKPREEGIITMAERGRAVYLDNCMACHGENRGGNEGPSLVNIGKRLSAGQILTLINGGRGRMPSFATQISEADKGALLTYLLNLKKEGQVAFKEPKQPNKEPNWIKESPSIPYKMTGYIRIKTPEGYPANKPPWGTLTAIDLNTGEFVWNIALGEYPELAKRGILNTGASNMGGAAVTSGGLIFIAATPDDKLRAFNKRTGKLLWQSDLPASGFATPATYEVNGKQYIVIACGGGELGAKSGDSYVAFALKKD